MNQFDIWQNPVNGDQPDTSLYLYRTTQHKNTRTTKINIHALREIRTRDPSIQTAKTYALDHAAILIDTTV
jgi:hypothetical protein